jgi:hypothetical protein
MQKKTKISLFYEKYISTSNEIRRVESVSLNGGLLIHRFTAARHFASAQRVPSPAQDLRKRGSFI